MITETDLQHLPIPLRAEIFREPCDGHGFPCPGCWYCLQAKTQRNSEFQVQTSVQIAFLRSALRLCQLRK